MRPLLQKVAVAQTKLGARCKTVLSRSRPSPEKKGESEKRKGKRYPIRTGSVIRTVHGGISGAPGPNELTGL